MIVYLVVLLSFIFLLNKTVERDISRYAYITLLLLSPVLYFMPQGHLLDIFQADLFGKISILIITLYFGLYELYSQFNDLEHTAELLDSKLLKLLSLSLILVNSSEFLAIVVVFLSLYSGLAINSKKEYRIELSTIVALLFIVCYKTELLYFNIYIASGLLIYLFINQLIRNTDFTKLLVIYYLLSIFVKWWNLDTQGVTTVCFLLSMLSLHIFDSTIVNKIVQKLNSVKSIKRILVKRMLISPKSIILNMNKQKKHNIENYTVKKYYTHINDTAIGVIISFFLVFIGVIFS